MELSVADRIWNRATVPVAADDRDRRSGDLALNALLKAHGLVMNGGVEQCHEILSPAEVAEAAAGYRYFDLEGAAALLESTASFYAAGRWEDEDEAAADTRYSQLIPDDDVLMGRFRARLESFPADFAPLVDE